MYKVTFHFDKAKCLIFHLRKSDTKRQGITLAHCSAFIKNAEQRLLPPPDDFQEQQEEQEEEKEHTQGGCRKSLRAEDNPPEQAPAYQGGSVQTKEDFLREQTEQWLQFVKEKPVYQTTSLAHKARCLALHLRKSNSKSSKLTSAECRSLIKCAEELLFVNLEQDLEHIENTNEQDQGCSQIQEGTQVQRATELQGISDVPGHSKMHGNREVQGDREVQLAMSDLVNSSAEEDNINVDVKITETRYLMDIDDEDDDKDKDWCLKESKSERFKGRWKKEWEIE